MPKIIHKLAIEYQASWPEDHTVCGIYKSNYNYFDERYHKVWREVNCSNCLLKKPIRKKKRK